MYFEEFIIDILNKQFIEIYLNSDSKYITAGGPDSSFIIVLLINDVITKSYCKFFTCWRASVITT